jgi:predicted solute-binding protein
MAKMGKVIVLKLGKIEKKAMLKYLEDTIKNIDKEKDKINPREYEVARQTLRKVLKKFRKTEPNQECTLDETQYKFLKTSLQKIVEHNQVAFKDMFFLKRWFYRLLSKNYEHLYDVVCRKK